MFDFPSCVCEKGTRRCTCNQDGVEKSCVSDFDVGISMFERHNCGFK